MPHVRVGFARWWRTAVALLLTLASCAIAYLGLLRVIAVPAHHVLTLQIETPSRAVLKLSPDVGRGFFEADASFRELPSGGIHEVLVPAVATRVKLELFAESARASITRVSVKTKAGAAELRVASRRGRRVSLVVTDIPRPTVPPTVHVAIVAAALSCLLILLWSTRARRRVLAGAIWIRSRRAALSSQGALVVAVVFVATIGGVSLAADAFHVLVRPIDNPPYWPISIFEPVLPSALTAFVAALLFLCVRAVAVRAFAKPTSLLPCLLVGTALLVVTNGFRGYDAGYAEPTSGTQAYLPDAAAIQNVADFVMRFADVQPSLRIHSRTHPPGAVLLYYAMLQMTSKAGVIAALLGVSSFLATLLLVFRLVRERVGRGAAVRAAWTFALIPAVQVYFIASLDAVVCAVFTAAVYCFASARPVLRLGATAALLVGASWLTFAALFLVLALFAFDAFDRKSVRSASVVAAGAVAAHLCLYWISDFDWLESFSIAARLENPRGFRLFSDPGSYFFTRLECVAEIAWFAGPFLLLAVARALRRHGSRGELENLARVSAVSLGMMFATGAYKTGETARACLFIFPILVLPLGRWFASRGAAKQDQQTLVSALAAQTVAFQLFGDYYW